MDRHFPPHELDIEKAVLGEIILEAGAILQVVDILPNELVFYSPVHQKIYQAILHLHNQENSQIDLITISDALKKRKELQACGGLAYLKSLTDLISSAVHVETHAKLLVEKYLRRKIIEISTKIQKVAYDEGVDVFDALDEAGETLLRVSEQLIKKEVEALGDVTHRYLKTVEARKDKKTGLTGVPTGFEKLDKLTGGWQPSDLIIVAGRPSMGKTAFSISMVVNMAVELQKPVGFFSLEMSSLQLAFRTVVAYTEIVGKKLQEGHLSDREWAQLLSLPDKFINAPLFLDETPALSMMELRTKARKLKIKHKVELLVVDYLQLMRADIHRNHNNREQEIAFISRSLKALAKELNIPIIALSQLSRAVEIRGGDKRPVLSDLRESGSIEQDADIVIFLYRPEYYGIRQDDQGMPTRGIAEIIVEKHRNGPTGTLQLAFLHEYAKFTNLSTQGDVTTLSSRINGDEDDEAYEPPPAPF